MEKIFIFEHVPTCTDVLSEHLKRQFVQDKNLFTKTYYDEDLKVNVYEKGGVSDE